MVALDRRFFFCSISEISPFLEGGGGCWHPQFWTSCDIFSGFQRQSEFSHLRSYRCCSFPRSTFGTTPTELFAARMAAEPLLVIYFSSTGVSGSWTCDTVLLIDTLAIEARRSQQVFVVVENLADGRTTRYVPGTREGSTGHQGIHSAPVLPGRQGG